MDNRVLIAFGMLLTLALVALLKGSLDSSAVKEIVQSFGTGILGYMAHKVTAPQRPPKPPPAPDDHSGKVRSDAG